jgi:hypothetical protein
MINLENQAGTVFSAYKETLISIHHALLALEVVADYMPEDAPVPTTLINATNGLFAALKLGRLHFPDFNPAVDND